MQIIIERIWGFKERSMNAHDSNPITNYCRLFNELHFLVDRITNGKTTIPAYAI